MANILLLSVGSSGDINPFIGLGIALRRRGHKSTLIANEHFERMAKTEGLTFAASGAATEYEQMVDGRLVGGRSKWNSREGMTALMNYCTSSMVQGYARIEELQRKGETMIIGSRFAYASLIAKDKLNLPTATVLVNMTSIPSIYSPPTGPSLPFLARYLGPLGARILFRIGRRRAQELFGKPINEFRDSLGLPGILDFRQWLDSSNILIAAWPEWLYGRQPDWPENSVSTGFLEYDGSMMTLDHKSKYDEIEPSQAVRPIVFTAGSAVSDAKTFFEYAVKALTMLNHPGILLCPHRDQLPSRLPRFINHLDFAPLGILLSRAAAIVHYGGIGTAARALKAGIPQCISPLDTDHFENARRLEKLGVAQSIAQAKISPTRMATALKGLLGSKVVAERCRYFAGEMSRIDAMQMTCDLIDQWCQRSLANDTSNSVSAVPRTADDAASR